VIAAGALAACGRIDFVLAHDAGNALDADAERAMWKVDGVVGSSGNQISITAAAGDLLVLDVDPGSHPDEVVSIADDTGDVFAMLPNGTQMLNGDVGFQLYYVEGARAGQHTISVTMASGMSTGLVVWDVAGIATSGAVDTVNGTSEAAATTLPETPEITTSIRGEFVLAVATLGEGFTGLAAGSPFTIDSNLGGDAFSHLADASAPIAAYQAIWEQQPAGTYCSAIAGFLTAP